MGKKVCIAEKPSVAREVASAIGATAKKRGYYEGNGFQVTWCLGHLCQLKEPGDYLSSWKKWDMDALPIFPEIFELKLISGKGQQEQFKVIRELIQDSDEVIGCCDAGQEGELIQRWVMELSGCKKPFKRLWISSLTEEAIHQGFSNLRDSSEFDSLYEAGRSRAICDWLLGMNATRLFTKKYGQYQKGVLSIGRVQTPTLAMVVERHCTISQFQPELYWHLKTTYRNVIFQCAEGKFDKIEKGEAVLQTILGSPLTIHSNTTSQGKEFPPLLYDLTTLQMEGNRKFSFTADYTLKTLQSLYEKKLITYPRVDTRYLTQDLYPKIPAILEGLIAYQIFIEPLLQQPLKKSSRIFNDLKVTDHHAIIPTGKLFQHLPDSEWKLYDLIAKRLVAAFYPECIISQTRVLADIQEHRFKATGKQILDPGWRSVYGKDVPEEKHLSKDESTQSLPVFEEGESGSHRPDLEQKTTRPPRPYTEATLLHAMEMAGKTVEDEELQQLMKENGIGRPATRASILETLLKRGYIMRQKKILMPTQKGIDLIGLIQNDTLKSAEMTGAWEKCLRQIETGTILAEDFLADMKQFVSQIIEEVKNDFSTVPISLTARSSQRKILGSCPKCGQGQVIAGKRAWGCSNWRSKDGACDFRIWYTRGGKKISEIYAKLLLDGKQTPVIDGFTSNYSKPFSAALHLNDRFEMEYLFDKE
ncbi:MAG: DNA topoisomerase 3 [SAR324 cluster bacterium]|nr:DNA topoisomerase 3 [SAR324 cluster bacterium]